MDPMILALILFGIMYVLLLIFSEKRWIIALTAFIVLTLMGMFHFGFFD